jgi:hypothetical protein
LTRKPEAFSVVYLRTMQQFFRSPAFLRGFMWVSVMVLIAGVVAFATARLGGSSTSSSSAVSLPDELPAPAPPPPASKIPKEAREVAGQFILAAAGRENLAQAWKIAHPDLKAQCGCTYKEWLTGNIPVQPYPIDAIDQATFAVDELSTNRVVLLVALLPKAGSTVKAQAFFIGLKAIGKGKSKHWLVDYWAPRSATPIPAAP